MSITATQLSNRRDALERLLKYLKREYCKVNAKRADQEACDIVVAFLEETIDDLDAQLDALGIQ